MIYIVCLYKKTHEGDRSFEIWDESYPLTTSLVSFPSNHLDCFYFLKTSIRISDERLPWQPKDGEGLLAAFAPNDPKNLQSD